MKTNTLEYAKALAQRQGPSYALAIAESMLETTRVVVSSSGGCPFAPEVVMQEQTYVDKETKQQKTKTVTFVNEAAKATRQGKTLLFWQNVSAHLRKMQPKKAA